MKEAAKALERNIFLFNVYNALFGVAFFVPVMVLFWKDNGLSFQQIMYLQSFFAITMVVLEVPSGMISDRIGRRRTLMAGSAFIACGVGMYSVTHTFTEFLAVEFTYAVGAALISGTDCAIIYDTLAALKRQREYNQIMGHAMFSRMMSMGVTTFLGGFIGEYSYRLAFAACVPFLLLKVLVSYRMVDPGRKGCEPDCISHLIRFEVLENPRVRWIMAYAACVGTFIMAGFWLYQPYLLITGLSVGAIGVVFSSFNLVGAVSSKLAHPFIDGFGRGNAFLILGAMVPLGYLLMGSYISYYSFAFVYIFQFIRGTYNILVTEAINEAIGSVNRATILSIMNLITRLLIAASLPAVGYMADDVGVVPTHIVMGVATALFMTFLLALMKAKDII